MEVRGKCLRCGGIVRYRPVAVGVAGSCDLCGNRYRLIDGVAQLLDNGIDLTEVKEAVSRR